MWQIKLRKTKHEIRKLDKHKLLDYWLNKSINMNKQSKNKKKSNRQMQIRIKKMYIIKSSNQIYIYIKWSEWAELVMETVVCVRGFTSV